MERSATSEKYSKEEVAYESPAKGMNRCSACVHYEVKHRCEIVTGVILPGDWCKKWKAKRHG